MVARIAPSPITTSVAVGDTLTHAAEMRALQATTQQFGNGSSNSFQQFDTAQASPTLAPPTPPGEAFAAAVIAGQLPPVPITQEQLRQRLGSSWQPPASPLRLMDRSA